MNNATFSAILAMTLGAVLLGGCGDSGVSGVGGGLVCASDDPEVGDMLTCPESDEVIDFCVNGRNGDCYYQIGGDRADCGNCLSNPSFNTCAAEAISFCN